MDQPTAKFFCIQSFQDPSLVPLLFYGILDIRLVLGTQSLLIDFIEYQHCCMQSI